MDAKALRLPRGSVRKLTARECREQAAEARAKLDGPVGDTAMRNYWATELRGWTKLAAKRAEEQQRIVERCKRGGWVDCNDTLVDAVLAGTATAGAVSPELRAFILRCAEGVG